MSSLQEGTTFIFTEAGVMKGDSPNMRRKDENKVKRVSSKAKKPGTGRRGRKPSKIDQKAKLERSRQSARECRARKKLRYQNLEKMVGQREREISKLREELETYKKWCQLIDEGILPPEIKNILRLAAATGRARKQASVNL
ncbi:cAMP-responsive element-binding protein-like 2 [Ptychodera flava]|uniref:cAMP-responsive element-binding protein-like 2 n=1 Tax=Ptychodera flava TaxID=63121 RepID=UPI00396A3C0D